MDTTDQDVYGIKPEPNSFTDSGDEGENNEVCFPESNIKTENTSDRLIKLEYPFPDLPIEFESKSDAENKGSQTNVGERVVQPRTDTDVYLADVKQQCQEFARNAHCYTGFLSTNNTLEDPLERKRRQARERTRRYRERLTQNSKAVFDEEERRKQEEEAQARRLANAHAQARRRARESSSEAQARRSANALAQARKRAREAQTRGSADAQTHARKVARQSTTETQPRRSTTQS